MCTSLKSRIAVQLCATIIFLSSQWLHDNDSFTPLYKKLYNVFRYSRTKDFKEIQSMTVFMHGPLPDFKLVKYFAVEDAT